MIGDVSHLLALVVALAGSPAEPVEFDPACGSMAPPDTGLVVLASEGCRPCRTLGRLLRDREAALASRSLEVTFAYTDCRSCGSPRLASERSGAWPSACMDAGNAWARAATTTPILLHVVDGGLLRFRIGALNGDELEAWLDEGAT